MNEQSKRKMIPRNYFSALDLALLLLAVLVAVAIWQRSNLRFLFEGDRVKASYSVTLSVNGVRPEVADLLSADTALFLKGENSTEELGRLVDDPLLLPRTVILPEAGDTAVLLPPEDERSLVDINATLLCRGIVRDGALVLDSGAVLQPGAELAVFTEKGEVTVVILSVTENV